MHNRHNIYFLNYMSTAENVFLCNPRSAHFLTRCVPASWAHAFIRCSSRTCRFVVFPLAVDFCNKLLRKVLRRFGLSVDSSNRLFRWVCHKQVFDPYKHQCIYENALTDRVNFQRHYDVTVRISTARNPNVLCENKLGCGIRRLRGRFRRTLVFEWLESIGRYNSDCVLATSTITLLC